MRLLLGEASVVKIACCTLWFVASLSAQAELPHVYRVDQHIYRGKQPSKAEFQELAKMGIKTVLDLRGGPIHKPRERKEVKAAGMEYVSLRLSGLFEPKDRQIAQVLDVMEDPARWPVFVHCWRGDDRVGMVIACYRMVHDHWSNKQALDEARRFGISRFEPLLRRYIRKFDASRVRDMMDKRQPAGS